MPATSRSSWVRRCMWRRHNDSVTAPTRRRAKGWRFLTEGPVRLAPVAWKDRVFRVDDGHRPTLWRRLFRAVPSSRKVRATGG